MEEQLKSLLDILTDKISDIIDNKILIGKEEKSENIYSVENLKTTLETLKNKSN